MYLSELNLFSFRNYRDLSLKFHPKINIVVGPNGQGKTNLLEAIYLLANLKSFRSVNREDLILHEQTGSFIKGTIVTDGLETEYFLGLTERGKIPKINGKNASVLKDYYGKLSVVAFSPEDQKLIKGGPEFRRSFIDQFIFRYLPEYLEIVQKHQKILKCRNALLKDGWRLSDAELKKQLEPWDEQLCFFSAQIAKRRYEAIGRLSGKIDKLYVEIAGKEGAFLNEEEPLFSLEYLPNPTEIIGLFREFSIDIISSFYRDCFMRSFSQDKGKGYTTVGPHRDEIDFKLGHHSMRGVASQGQQKTAILACKVAEIEDLFNRRDTPIGLAPILLIDDISSELDSARRRKIFELVSSKDLQVFISTTEPSISEEFSEGCYQLFNVFNGSVS